MDSAKHLASRGYRYLAYTNVLGESASLCRDDPYDAVTNKKGYVNMGTSENRMVFDILKEKFNKLGISWEDDMFLYKDFRGIPELRQSVAKFLSDRVKSLYPLDPDKFLVLNGGGVAMEALSFALCDPGDGVMVATPYYGGINKDFTVRPEAKIIHVHFYSKLGPDQDEPFKISTAQFESVYQEQTAKGVCIKVVIFMNPNNPLGDVYTKQDILDMIQFCHRHSLHLIMNEVYMNTIFKEGVQHQSILGLDPEDIPDKEKVHFVWCASKDLSMSGMRVGFLYLWNRQLFDCILATSYFHLLPVYIQRLMADFFSDKVWFDTVYFPTNKKRLLEAHRYTTEALDEIGIPYLNRPACLYVYADFRKFLPSVTTKNELAFHKHLLQNGVYIVPSQAFYTDEHGWFRIIFSRPISDVKEGMKRITKTCKEFLEKNKNTVQSRRPVEPCEEGDD